ncbi:MAG: hypothetical protein AAF495_22705 [Pseudomonadota bacterium]
MRRHLPFAALWSMQIEVPVSLLLRDGDLAWSCGQCPLDGSGQVIAPGDLAAQSEAVADYIAEVLARGDLSAEDIGLLLAYYVDGGPGSEADMVAILQRRLGGRALILPVPVPHFYYAGMMIEVDVFASAAAGTRRRHQAGSLEIEMLDGGALTWVKLSLSTPCPADRQLGALGELGLEASALLRDHWFLPADDATLLESAAAAGLVTDPGAAVFMPSGDAKRLLGELTFARGKTATRHAEAGAVTLHLRRHGEFLWALARDRDPRADLVGQTERIMPALKDALALEGMSFADVVKLTTHYVGDDSPEALHDNMRVRNAYYATPGPTSTGLPVAGLGDPQSLITVNLLARRAGP